MASDYETVSKEKRRSEQNNEIEQEKPVLKSFDTNGNHNYGIDKIVRLNYYFRLLRQGIIVFRSGMKY